MNKKPYTKLLQHSFGYDKYNTMEFCLQFDVKKLLPIIHHKINDIALMSKSNIMEYDPKYIYIDVDTNECTYVVEINDLKNKKYFIYGKNGVKKTCSTCSGGNDFTHKYYYSKDLSQLLDFVGLHYDYNDNRSKLAKLVRDKLYVNDLDIVCTVVKFNDYENIIETNTTKLTNNYACFIINDHDLSMHELVNGVDYCVTFTIFKGCDIIETIDCYCCKSSSKNNWDCIRCSSSNESTLFDIKKCEIKGQCVYVEYKLV